MKTLMFNYSYQNKTEEKQPQYLTEITKLMIKED
jgi:hypothetical protein